VLEISRNRIESLSYLALPSLHTLEKVNCAHNKIPKTEIENVAHVTLALSNLKELDLYGNEVASEPSYKFRLTENSSLLKLDGLDVKGVLKQRLEVNFII